MFSTIESAKDLALPKCSVGDSTSSAILNLFVVLMFSTIQSAKDLALSKCSVKDSTTSAILNLFVVLMSQHYRKC